MKKTTTAVGILGAAVAIGAFVVGALAKGNGEDNYATLVRENGSVEPVVGDIDNEIVSIDSEEA